ncbi:hypothetical protein HYH02_011752 [Chlamydomonas schloesseri]|uniref:Uncharacterized protein n=1 Tax=Chlamydomonas schloesseri TaxID=2026947 RepID=A0A835TD55_9CHLO|nr:hypothetical protein HYH02_011752 [Chlamydomonas schloesseri]|eukprot:KAG2436041.1 hypothetical protein HYH02_011752 [Chlamydomonas schloesseri]
MRQHVDDNGQQEEGSAEERRWQRTQSLWKRAVDTVFPCALPKSLRQASSQLINYHNKARAELAAWLLDQGATCADGAVPLPDVESFLWDNFGAWLQDGAQHWPSFSDFVVEFLRHPDSRSVFLLVPAPRVWPGAVAGGAAARWHVEVDQGAVLSAVLEDARYGYPPQHLSAAVALAAGDASAAADVSAAQKSMAHLIHWMARATFSVSALKAAEAAEAETAAEQDDETTASGGASSSTAAAAAALTAAGTVAAAAPRTLEAAACVVRREMVLWLAAHTDPFEGRLRARVSNLGNYCHGAKLSHLWQALAADPNAGDPQQPRLTPFLQAPESLGVFHVEHTETCGRRSMVVLDLAALWTAAMNAEPPAKTQTREHRCGRGVTAAATASRGGGAAASGGGAAASGGGAAADPPSVVVEQLDLKELARIAFATEGSGSGSSCADGAGTALRRALAVRLAGSGGSSGGAGPMAKLADLERHLQEEHAGLWCDPSYSHPPLRDFLLQPASRGVFDVIALPFGGPGSALVTLKVDSLRLAATAALEAAARRQQEQQRLAQAEPAATAAAAAAAGAAAATATAEAALAGKRAEELARMAFPPPHGSAGRWATERAARRLRRALVVWLAGSPCEEQLGPLCAPVSDAGAFLRLNHNSDWLNRAHGWPTLKTFLLQGQSRGVFVERPGLSASAPAVRLDMGALCKAAAAPAAVADSSSAASGGEPSSLVAATASRRATAAAGGEPAAAACASPPQQPAAAAAAESFDTLARRAFLLNSRVLSDTERAARTLRRALVVWLAGSPCQQQLGPLCAPVSNAAQFLRKQHADLWCDPAHAWPKAKEFLLEGKSRRVFVVESGLKATVPLVRLDLNALRQAARGEGKDDAGASAPSWTTGSTTVAATDQRAVSARGRSAAQPPQAAGSPTLAAAAAAAVAGGRDTQQSAAAPPAASPAGPLQAAKPPPLSWADKSRLTTGMVTAGATSSVSAAAPHPDTANSSAARNPPPPPAPALAQVTARSTAAPKATAQQPHPPPEQSATAPPATGGSDAFQGPITAVAADTQHAQVAAAADASGLLAADAGSQFPLPAAEDLAAAGLPDAGVCVVDDPYGEQLIAMLQHCGCGSSLGLAVQAHAGWPVLVSLYAPPALMQLEGPDGGEETVVQWPAAVYLVDPLAAAAAYGGGADGDMAAAALLCSLQPLLEAPSVTKVVFGGRDTGHDAAGIRSGSSNLSSSLACLIAAIDSCTAGSAEAVAAAGEGGCSIRPCVDSAVLLRGLEAILGLPPSVSAQASHVARLRDALAGTGLWADRPQLLAALTARHFAALREDAQAAVGADEEAAGRLLTRPLAPSQVEVAAQGARHLPELWAALVQEAVPWVAEQATAAAHGL